MTTLYAHPAVMWVLADSALHSCCLSPSDAHLRVSAEACKDDLASLELVLERRLMDRESGANNICSGQKDIPSAKLSKDGVAAQALASQQDQRMGNGQHRPQPRSATLTQAAQPWTPGIRCKHL